jgi:Tat protein secretion system quality control protein TatD with DNase activity
MRNNQKRCLCCEFWANDFFSPELSGDVRNTAVDKILDNKDDKAAVIESDSVPSPRETWNILSQQPQKLSDHKTCLLLLVDTHGHAHLNGEVNDFYGTDPSSDESIITLTCAVSQSDWESCLSYVAQSPHRMGAIGIHPWYLADLKSTWLEDLECLISEHPGCMVGEIGLCKMARFVRNYEHGKQAALELQRHVFMSQMKLAARYQRPVSIHCVDQHGILLDMLKSLRPSELPPVMALHSFSGSAHHVEQLLRWEDDLFKIPTRNKNKNLPSQTQTAVRLLPECYEQPLIYFGFSYTINYAMCSSDKSRKQGREAIRRVPSNRLLAESDVQAHDSIAGATAGALGYIAWALDKNLIEVAELTKENGLKFLSRERRDIDFSVSAN